MNADIYHFELGDFHCVAVSDDTHTYAPPALTPTHLRPSHRRPYSFSLMRQKNDLSQCFANTTYSQNSG